MRRAAFSILAVLLSVSGCGTEGDPVIAQSGAAPPVPVLSPSTLTPSTVAGQPRTLAGVRKAAADAFNAFSAGEYGVSWDAWTAEGKKIVTRDYYAKVHAVCEPLFAGAPFKIKKIVLSTDRMSAKIRTARTAPRSGTPTVTTYTFRYEDGQWRWAPAKELLADYRLKLTVPKLAARWKTAGHCADPE